MKCAAIYVYAACGWCAGDVLKGYKGRARYQKCLRCHRVSYAADALLHVKWRPW